ncbi:MAG TPA: hypothetical protein PLP19_19365 [bacterium]|nr:hypothetical protein [bacterium]HPN45656.1 hypothetical protein [bacterium]
MKYSNIKIKVSWLHLLAVITIVGLAQSLYAQKSGEMKWLRVNSLHTFFSEQGSETEGGYDDLSIYFSWPAEYGLRQTTMRSRGVMIGCEKFYDSKMKREYSPMVVNIGPKPTTFQQFVVFNPLPGDFQLIGKTRHPSVVVDDEVATVNDLYDVLDKEDDTIPADRILILKNHTLMGVTITKKVYAFTQQNHDNYYIFEYTLKNTGIVNANDLGNIQKQTLEGVYFYLMDRYAMSGESVPANGQGWGIWNTTWGYNMVCDVIGANPAAADFKYRANIAWYGPHSERNVSDDWGCPNQLDDGVMAAAKYIGHITLHADKSAADHSDNPYQPRTTYYIGADAVASKRASSEYDETVMSLRYEAMTKGHAEQTQAQLVGTGYADLYTKSSGDIGGTIATQGFGPYILAWGDSIQFVLAQGVAGLSREKNREVGGNWLQWTNHNANAPVLFMPNNTQTTDFDAYKKAWVQTGRDSIMKTFENAARNYNSGYNIPQPPPPPSEFIVKSGGDRIRLTWANNASTTPGFEGYVIYRSEGSVMDPKTVYKKIFECSAADVVHTFDDTSAVRGFNYYYYIQSKGNSALNDVNPGTPLVSSMFWTLTSKAAYLRRPAHDKLADIRVVPNPYDLRARAVQFGDDFQYDRIAFYGLPPECNIKIFTERGDLIWEREHNDGSGDELWDSLTSSGQIIVSGIYIAYFETPAGESVYRKFVVIR